MNLVPATPAPSIYPDQPGQYIAYSSIDGDRWDSIANKHYGDPTQLTALIMANPAVPIVDVLPAGTQLAVPMIGSANNQSQGGTTSNPPWSQ
ncbi:MAG: tail protein X [Patescibacteria group bacterium]|nr:tail protein X [Patescibacteria group bacterium]